MPLIYRVSKKRHAVFSGDGSVLIGGRWSSPGRAVIYATRHYATALLEIMVQANQVRLPGSHHAAAIIIPDDLPTTRFDPATHPGWERPNSSVARAYGDMWHSKGETAVLIVPSVPGRPVEMNYLINPAHPDASYIESHAPFDVIWDERMTGAYPK